MAKDKSVQRFKISCVGVSPMLQNRITDDFLIKKGVEQRLYKGPKGEFGIPSYSLFRSLVEAGRHVVFGDKRLSTKKTSFLPDILSIVDEETGMLSEFIPFSDQSLKWGVKNYKYAIGGVAGGTISMPIFKVWAFESVVEVRTKQLNIEKVVDLFNKAGMFCGLGNFRPSRRGSFGRFKVDKFVQLEQIEAEDRQAA